MITMPVILQTQLQPLSSYTNPMGYSKNISTFNQMKDQLTLLSQQTPCSWDRPSGDADNFAYKIREALFIASLESQKHPKDPYWLTLALVRKTWEIRVISPFKIEAAPGLDIELDSRPTPSAPSNQPAGKVPILAQVRTAEDVIAFWTKLQPSNDKIHFPQILLSDQDIGLVADWAAGLTPSWMVLRPKGTTSLTLAPDDPNVPAAARVTSRMAAKPRRFEFDPEAVTDTTTPQEKSGE